MVGLEGEEERLKKVLIISKYQDDVAARAFPLPSPCLL